MSEKKQSFFGKLFSKKQATLKDVDTNQIVTPTQAIINNFKENKLAVAGLFGFIFIVLFVFVGSLFVKFDGFLRKMGKSITEA